MLSAHFPDGLCLWSTLVEYHSNYGNRPRRIFVPLLSSLPDGCTSEPPSLVRRTHDPGGLCWPAPGTSPGLSPQKCLLAFCPQPSAESSPSSPRPHTHVDELCGQPGAGLSREVLGRTRVGPACRGTGAPEGSRRGTPHPRPPIGPCARELFPHRALPSSLLACDKPVSQPLARRA